MLEIFVYMISWWNKVGRLAFQDINATGFDPARCGKTFDELMAEIHGVYPDGRIVNGAAAFRGAYGAIGLGWLLAPTGWPLLKPFFDRLYAQFAKHRIRLGYVLGAHSCKDGRCEYRGDEGRDVLASEDGSDIAYRGFGIG